MTPTQRSHGVTADELWAAIRQRDANINAFFAALKVEEKYLLEHFDADCGIMPGDVEGSFHRLREAFYQTTPCNAPSERTQDRGEQ